MIRYCRDLRNRATAAKAIRRRLVAFQVLLPTTMDSVSCIQRIILRHGGILNETVELIKTPLIIPAGVQVSLHVILPSLGEAVWFVLRNAELTCVQ